MTSTSSSSKRSLLDGKLLKNTLRRHLWLILLFSVLLFLILPVSTAMIYDNAVTDMNELLIGAAQDFTLSSSDTRMLNNPFHWHNFVIYFSAMAGFATALLIWNFLFKKKQTDFYHSLPYKRSTLFVTFGLAGILMYAIPFAVMKLLQMAVLPLTASAYISYFNWGDAWIGIGYNAFVFFLAFAFTTLACMLSGNLPVAICGVGALTLGMGLHLSLELLSILFWGHHNFSSTLIGRIFLKTNIFFDMAEQLSQDYLELSSLLYWSAIGVLLLLLSAWLYSKRPSEAAGKSLSFSKTRYWISYPIVLIFSILGGFFFYGINARSFGWFFFGIVLGGVLSHAILQVIFDIDIHSLTKGWKGFGIFAVAASLLITVFVMDLFGIDSYVPKSIDNLNAISISFNNFDGYYEEDALERFSYTDPAISQMILDAAQAIRDKEKAEDRYTFAHYFQDPASRDQVLCYGATFRYQPKVGSAKERSYSLPADLAQPLYKALFNHPQYKEQQLAYEKSIAASSTHVRISNDSLSEKYTESRFDLSEDRFAELWSAYEKDYLNLSAEDVMSMSPQFSLFFNSRKNHFWRPDLLVYPTFVNTLAVLDKYNIVYPVHHTDLAPVAMYLEFRLPSAEENIELLPATESSTTAATYPVANKDYISANYSYHYTEDPAEMALLLENAICPINTNDNNPLLVRDDSSVSYFSVLFSDGRVQDGFGYFNGGTPEIAKTLSPTSEYRGNPFSDLLTP